jgi:hypothetical protein
MNITTAKVTLTSTSPYSQSRKHDTPKLEGESANAHEERTWKERMHVRTINKGKPTERKTVVMPAAGFNQAIAAAAKFLNKKIEGQRNSTWTKHFVSGIAVLADVDLNISPDDCRRQVINAHANGVRGSGTRVTRFFPTFDEWEATFEVMVLDPLITEAIFTEVIEAAGLFVGVGQHRPEQLGTNGRWEIVSIDWQDARKVKPALKKAA